jgi:TonB family protein
LQVYQNLFFVVLKSITDVLFVKDRKSVALRNARFDLYGKFKSKVEKEKTEMPLNVRKFCTSILLVFIFSFIISAQTTSSAPSAADVMRERVAKAKASIVVKNYNAAIYELENIRRESSDQTVQSVTGVLLMNSYLEQGDYKRAQDFLGDLAKAQKAGKANAAANYFAVAGQVVKGARTQLERYKSLGLSVSDRNLPAEASTDVQKMRETLETIVAQSKVLGADKKQTADAMALLEEATNARSGLAKDDYDAKRWKDEVGDAREQLANSRSVIVNAAGEPTTEMPKTNNVAVNSPVGTNQTSTPVQNSTVTQNSTTVMPQPTPSVPVFRPVQNSNTDSLKQTPSETTAKTVNKPVELPKTTSENPTNTNAQTRNRRAENANTETAFNQRGNSPELSAAANDSDASKNVAPLQVGSLIEFATQKTNPVYPPTARTLRTSGIVRVELTVDEKGQVAQVQNTSGPTLLQRAATDAVKKWKFKPFVRNGEPVKANGFVSFNFSL